ncbi:glycosyl transferase family 2 [Rippkaea orientalis PCC 8801]|uniref:Beta-monoglucosyldiacylglycerol synthase n=1 Tax=Rippkaea orientalis (strain PCC 8801 / RF-1) TaxID=41431 RepID=B7JWP1_RIPO1|nr:glycosyltransferase family 2 protein [Rippkaea orientalis]ACK64687.1 glycosyl transferase family 2 [Rippkaea orientalis PCC 8801]
MPNNYWTDDAEHDLDPLSSLLSEWSNLEEEEEEFRSDFFQGLSGRRKKAAFVLMTVWGITVGLHLVSWGTWVVLGLTVLFLIQALRLINAQPDIIPEPLSDEALEKAPSVSLLVAAKNEEAVIGKLVTMLCNLDYPTDRYDLCVVDDHSTDKTPEILTQLAQKYPQLQIIRRPATAQGGKSGALNEALAQTKGDIIGVFDADAKVSQDLLRHVVPLFESEEMGAVQVRKSIANSSLNFWTKGQSVEMALDGYFQQQRIAIGGIGELRGNGQFVRRSALSRCGGWNEQTITDDLDLTIRLHLDHWKIGFLPSPAVEEEGVTTAKSLWHQRNRWGEGGYQRYLDYWRFILSQRLGWNKTIDLLSFILMQYLVLMAAIPDFMMVVLYHRLPIFSPLTALILSLSSWGVFNGLRRSQNIEKLGLIDTLRLVWQSLSGTFYMMHWFIIIPSVTTRMSIRPKRLKWVKTIHEGTPEESFEF